MLRLLPELLESIFVRWDLPLIGLAITKIHFQSDVPWMYLIKEPLSWHLLSHHHHHITRRG